MLWQPLACQPPSNLGNHQRSPWRQVTPGFSPAAMRYASQQQCSSSSSEQQPGSVASSSQSVRLRHTTPLDRRQQQVQQQLRQSCQQLQELARLLSSPQQGDTYSGNLCAPDNSSAGSAMRQCAASSSGFLSSVNFSQQDYSPPTGVGAASMALTSSSSSLGAALQAAEARLGLPADSDAGSGLSTLQQLASAISKAAAPSTAWTADTTAQTLAAQQHAGTSCVSSHGSISIKRCTASPDECITPTAGERKAVVARVYGDSPVEAVSSPPPCTGPQHKHEPQQQQQQQHGCSTSSAAAASSAAASYKELLNKCQVSKARIRYACSRAIACSYATCSVYMDVVLVCLACSASGERWGWGHVWRCWAGACMVTAPGGYSFLCLADSFLLAPALTAPGTGGQRQRCMGADEPLPQAAHCRTIARWQWCNTRCEDSTCVLPHPLVSLQQLCMLLGNL
jgi:hypothetical protein